MAISKVVYGGNTLIDLTADTVKAEHLIKGYTAHGADGEPITGTNDWDSNTMSATAADSEILLSKTAYVKGAKKTGTMPNNGAVSGAISTKAGVYTVPKGYHDGSGKVQIASAEQAKLIPENVREGITLLGVVGTMSGTEDAIPQAKEVTPSTTEQEVLPDTGYNFLSSVTVKPIPYTETANSAGGMTVTIA